MKQHIEESETESGQETTGAKVVSGIEIYRDGEKQPIEVSAGGQWKSSGVEGDSIPTQRALSVEEFAKVKNLYFGITEGIEDDPNDEVNYMLNKPFEMAMVYEGTVIDDGKE